jgi:hypothetical protein
VFAECRFRDLPDFVAEAVTDQLYLDPDEWDEVVSERRVAELVDLHSVFVGGVMVPPQGGSRPGLTDRGIVDPMDLGHRAEFRSRQSGHPGYTWEDYVNDVERRAGRHNAVNSHDDAKVSC